MLCKQRGKKQAIQPLRAGFKWGYQPMLTKLGSSLDIVTKWLTLRLWATPMTVIDAGKGVDA